MVRVLIVNDDQSLLKNTSVDLEERGYTVLRAHSGSIALGMLDSSVVLPDAIVCTQNMAEMNGFQFLEAVRHRPQYASVPFILLGETFSLEALRAAKKSGVDDFLAQPFEIEDLIISIENRLRRFDQWKASAYSQIEQVRQELITLLYQQQQALNVARNLYGESLPLIEELEAMPDEFSQRALEAIRAGMRHLNRLVGQIMLLSKLDNHDFHTRYEEETRLCALKTLLETSYRMVSQDLETSPDVFQSLFPSHEVFVRGFCDLLIVAFSEALRNAAAAAPPHIPIIVDMRVSDTNVIIEIEDRGYGFTREELRHLGERFVQFNSMPKGRGAGLGLSIVYEIMRLHQGTLEVQSTPNSGTLVTLKLPVSAKPKG